MFIVYRAFGTHSTQSYYAYAKGEEKEDALKTFLVGAHRTEERGDSLLFMLNNQDELSMDIEILDVFEDELDAYMLRNELRVIHSDSITGPTPWPGNMARRAENERPEELEAYRKRLKIRGAKSARQAYALGLWTKAVIDNLASWSTNKPQLKKDFDKLSPSEFSIKYSI